MAYKAPKLAKSKTWCAIFAGISLIAKWLCDGYLIIWLIAKIWLLAKWFWDILLIASFFRPEVHKMQFSTFHLNPKQLEVP